MAEKSLIDYLAEKINCTYVSDLHYLDRSQKQSLANEIQKISPCNFSLNDWNDALEYIVCGKPDTLPISAKNSLIRLLLAY